MAKGRMMDDREFWRNERVAFLALSALKGLGFWTLHKLAESGVGFKKALKDPSGHGISKHFVDDGKDDAQQEALWAKGLETARELANMGIRLCFKGEPEFPNKLRLIPDSPHWLFIQGNLENLERRAVAIVGTRKPSEDGLFLTRCAVASLAGADCITVSGLATGIDQACHLESIRYRIPTVAVLGTGILNNYPKGSESIREQIIAHNGTILSEYLPNQSYSAENFVRRNRIQAGLCDILIPAEWQIKSGTAHTVKFAHKYNKKILNILLPTTDYERPELSFSAKEYGAESIELPIQSLDLLHTVVGFPGSSSASDELNEASESHITDCDTRSEASGELDNELTDPQLSLI
ncbi:DNA-processing protein DprA [Pseudomonas sp. 9Ag]|uniref:DNA-processing protein DprA n=1 Tax=Pseudomonas sp. 9Ag TaxID=2653167 RepID=UPI0012F0CCAD|nr:DNA-processing protein DprA [Pseudomonas sp. 9Ag]VXC99172.1 conserved hypothetical protein [Pseudomonas sp. 9Ag]